jgi:hypothetical protein
LQAARNAAHANAIPESAKRLGLLLIRPPQRICTDTTEKTHHSARRSI